MGIRVDDLEDGTSEETEQIYRDIVVKIRSGLQKRGMERAVWRNRGMNRKIP